MPERTSAASGGGASTENAGRIAARREPGPGILSRLPGMAYQCRNDPDWTMEFVSEGCRELTGYAPESLVGPGQPSWATIIHPGDRHRVWEQVQRALAAGEGAFQLQYRIVTAGDEVRDVWERGHVVRATDGELLGLEGFISDVTELEHRGRQLARTEALMRSVADQGLAGVYVIEDGLFRYVNAAFAAIFGYAMEEIQGRLGPLDLAAPDDHAKVASAIRSQLEEGEAGLRYEFSGRRKDGGAVRVEVHGSRVELDGRIAISGVMIDLTERRALEEQLRHAQRVQDLGDLTGAIAHDFNNYLTAILAPVELLLQDTAPDDEARVDLLLIRDTARQAASLTRQLLSFGRKRVYSPRPLVLDAVLDNLRGMLDRLVGERVTLELALGPDPPTVEADPSHMQQVVVNLVANARDAMPDGGRIVVTTGTTTVSDGEAEPGIEPGTYVTLSVADDGAGMEPSVLEHIFDPYFTTKETGTGLGLSTVYGIVKQHGGQIRVESAPGVGTRFTVLLPVREQAAAGREGRAESPGRAPADGRGRAILVVEDEDAVRRVTVAALRRFGYTVLEAIDGRAALELEAATARPIDLLLTDLMLPDLTGPELADRIRARRPGLPILLMSGYAPADVLRDPGKGPDFLFLEKPFVIDELLSAVARSLGDDEEEGVKSAC